MGKKKFLCRLKGGSTIHFFMAVSGLPCAYVLFKGRHLTLLELQASLALASFGAGPIFSLNTAWYEEFSPVDVSVAGLFFLGHSIGQKTWAPLVGAFIEGHPFVLFWVSAANAAVCFAVQVSLAAFSSRIKERIAEEKLSAEEDDVRTPCLIKR